MVDLVTFLAESGVVASRLACFCHERGRRWWLCSSSKVSAFAIRIVHLDL
jgi:hypothetical protein